jgi:hypothetical protein
MYGKPRYCCGMATHLDAEALRAKLISILGRIVTVEEVRGAMDLKTSTYYDQLREGKLISLDNLTTAARSLGINELYLLVECDLLDRHAAKQYAEHVASGDSGPLLTGPRKIREANGSLPETPDL